MGPTKRFLGSRLPGGDDASVGVGADFRAHVRLWSGLSVGAYAAWDWSAISDSTRHIFGLGIRARWRPLPTAGAFQWWVFGGLGYALAWSPSFETTVPSGTVKADGAVGSFFEVPIGLGAGWAPKRRGLQYTAELGAKVGFAHRGELYDLDGMRGATSTNSTVLVGITNPGADAVGLGLMLGINWLD